MLPGSALAGRRDDASRDTAGRWDPPAAVMLMLMLILMLMLNASCLTGQAQVSWVLKRRTVMWRPGSLHCNVGVNRRAEVVVVVLVVV